jgi:outer membrane biosynthesis protein TonB
MESYSKRTGKKFTGKFAHTAINIGLASENLEGNDQGESPDLPPKVETPKTPKAPKVPKVPKELKVKAPKKAVKKVEPKKVTKKK